MAADSQQIIEQLSGSEQNVYFRSDKQEVVDSLLAFLKPGDVVLLAGGADIPSLTKLLVARLNCQKKGSESLMRLISNGEEEKDSKKPLTEPKTSLALIESNFRSMPASTAISCGNSRLTYGELDNTSVKFARYIRRLCTRQVNVIALGLPPSIDHIACQLAVLRAGAACLSLDEKLPVKRLAHMVHVAKADLLITNKGSSIDKAITGIDKLYLNEPGTDAGFKVSPEKKTERKAPELATEEIVDIAFICFTSGSTGKPKGIPISHDSLAVFLPAGKKRFQLSDKSITIKNSSLAFDVSIAEVMLTLTAGGEIQIPISGHPLLGRKLREFINQNSVTHLFATPSVLATLPEVRMDSLQVIISAGEVCPQTLADKLSENRRFINSYGPAEATIYATAWDYRSDQTVNIGSPLPHVDVHLLGSDNKPVKIGDVGEICLGGVGVCNRYLTSGDTYSEKFIEIEPEPGAPLRVYKTGDLGRCRSDGQFEYVGRLDNQIKIRGNRVELEEIEAAMLKLEFIVDAICYMDDSEEPSEIYAYYTTPNGDTIKEGEISRALSEWLPEYMLPSAYVHVTEITLTVTGKKDRWETARKNQLWRRHITEFVAPSGETQLKLAGLWQKALGVDYPIGQDHEFKLTGGDSVQYVLLMMDIEDEFSIDLPPGFLGQQDSLLTMAQQIDEHQILTLSTQNRSRFKDSIIFRQQKAFTADWHGKRHNDTSLIVSRGHETAEHHLSWCLQSGTELQNLATELGDRFCVHGMRSGHLVMDYNEPNLAALSSYYAEQVTLICPEGPLFLGGNCQGSQVAHAVALLLKKDGRNVRLLILMEQARFPAYEGRLAFIYGEDSFLNPRLRYDDDLSQYNSAYPQGYSLDVVPGGHGSFFRQPNIFYLASRISSVIELACITH